MVGVGTTVPRVLWGMTSVGSRAETAFMAFMTFRADFTLGREDKMIASAEEPGSNYLRLFERMSCSVLGDAAAI